MPTSFRGHANLWAGTPSVMSLQSCDHKRCDGENIMFLNCPRSLVVKACLKDYVNLRVKARRVSHHLIGPVQVEILNI